MRPLLEVAEAAELLECFRGQLRLSCLERTPLLEDRDQHLLQACDFLGMLLGDVLELTRIALNVEKLAVVVLPFAELD